MTDNNDINAKANAEKTAQLKKRHVPKRTTFFAPRGFTAHTEPTMPAPLDIEPGPQVGCRIFMNQSMKSHGVDLTTAISEQNPQVQRESVSSADREGEKKSGQLEDDATAKQAKAEVMKAQEDLTKREIAEVSKELQSLEQQKRTMAMSSGSNETSNASERESRVQELVAKRIELQQRQVREFERRMHSDKVVRMRKMLRDHYGFECVTDEECLAALAETNVEETAAEALMDFTYLKDLRRKIARSHTSEEELQRQREERSVFSNPENFVPRQNRKRAPTDEEKGQNEDRMQIEGEDYPEEFHEESKDSDEDSNSESDQEPDSENKPYEEEESDLSESSPSEDSDYERDRRKRRRRSVPRVSVDDGPVAGWSKARVRAWKHMETNPNAYYYRFNDQGEPQKHGRWGEEEKKHFLEMIKLHLDDSRQWGLFSRHIPGRVGYQCSNFYRQLVETGELQDPMFTNSNGKTTFIGRRNSKGVEQGEKKNPPRERAGKRKRSEEDDDDSQDDDFTISSSKGVTRSTRMRTHSGIDKPPPEERPEAEPIDEKAEKLTVGQNPLPELLDPITILPMQTPAISPYGHVCDYSTWMRCLATSGNICPFTKLPLKKRDLVILDWDNIEEYRDKIIK